MLSLSGSLTLGLGPRGAGGGAPSLDPSLTAPIISLAVAGDAYPPEFDAIIDETAQADTHGYTLQHSTTYAGLLSSPTEVSAVISDAEATANAITGNLSGIASGDTFMRLRIYEVATGNYSAWSNILKHGDVVAPTITSTDTATVAERQTAAKTVTTDELCYFTCNTAGFSFSGSQPATSIALVKDSAFDYEAATGHSVSITAADLAGLTADQTIAVTVTDMDEVPAAFTFTDVTGATRSTLYTSNTITVSGLDASITDAVVTITGGEYSKNGGAYTSAAGVAQNGDTFAVRVTSSGSYSTASDVVLTISGVSDTYTVTTEADPFAVPEMTQVDATTPVTIGATSKNFGTVDLGAEDPTRVIYIGVAFSPGAGGMLVSATLGGVAMTLVPGHVNGAGFFRLSAPTGTSAEFIMTMNNADSYGGAIVVWRYVNGTAAPTDAQGNPGSFDNYPRSVAATTPTGGFTLAINYAEDTASVCSVTNAVKGTQETANFITVVSALRTGASTANVTFSGLANAIANAQATLSVGP